MNYNPGKHHRRSIRLKGFDYSQPGAYFITLCVQDRICLFGDITDGILVLNDAGRMIEEWFFEIGHKFQDIQTDVYVVMPNHFHCIVLNVGADLRVCPDTSERPDNKGEHTGSPLPKIVQWYKTMTTNEYIKNVKITGWKPFNRILWQRNYYEHIIRNEIDLNRIREYIRTNPLSWDDDEENPKYII